MDDGQAKWLLLMVVAAFVLGAIVLWVRDDYRFEQIIESNKKFFPSVKVEAP